MYVHTRPSCHRLTAVGSAVAKGTGEMVDTVPPRGGGVATEEREGADAKRLLHRLPRSEIVSTRPLA